VTTKELLPELETLLELDLREDVLLEDCSVVIGPVVNDVGSTPDEPDELTEIELLVVELMDEVEVVAELEYEKNVIDVLEMDDADVGLDDVDEVETEETYPQGSVDSKSLSTYKLSFERPPQNWLLLPEQRMSQSEAGSGTVPFPRTTPLR